MRGDDPNAAHMFSYISPEQRVPADHPLRPIRQLTAGAFHLIEHTRGPANHTRDDRSEQWHRSKMRGTVCFRTCP